MLQNYYFFFIYQKKLLPLQRIMRRIILFIVCFGCTIALLGQTPSSADSQFKAGNYLEAQKIYKALLKNYPSNALYLYRYARCAQELGDDTTAIQYFDKAGDRYTLKHLYMGNSYLRLWYADEALASYRTYLQKEPDESQEYVQQQITRAELLQRYLRRVERVQIIDSVNVPLDSMLHVIQLSEEAGSLCLDTAGSIIYTNQRNERKLWSTFDEMGRILVSSQRLLDNWSTPDTLPDNINFTALQYSPYLLNDGMTLYFAAQDSNGIGNLDIYVSRYNTTTETYTTPENIGMPYNSPANEYMFVIDETKNIAYLATDRFAEKGRVHIYSLALPEQKQYWRNISHESLVKYAQLSIFERFNADTIINPIADKSIDKIKDFCFIINDSIVYYSLEDFQASTAREQYNEWKLIDQQYKSEQHQLYLLRQEYATADDDRKKELTPAILHLENNQSQLQVQCEQLLHSIRRIEMENNQQ
jgi:hypothetical protein